MEAKHLDDGEHLSLEGARLLVRVVLVQRLVLVQRQTTGKPVDWDARLQMCLGLFLNEMLAEKRALECVDRV